MSIQIPNDHALSGSSVPSIINLTLTDAETEYPQVLPRDLKKFTVQVRTVGATVRMAFEEGEVEAGEYLTIGSTSLFEDNLAATGITLYFYSPSQANVVIEILVWQ